MKKNIVRILSVLVLVAMCFSMFACKKDKEEKVESSTVTTSVNTDSSTEEDYSNYPEKLGKRNYDGREFIIGAKKTEPESFFTLYASEDGVLNFAVNDAMFYRDAEMMDNYGIDVNYLLFNGADDGKEIASRIQTAVLSNTYICDMISSNITNSLDTLFNNGLLYNIESIPVIDMTKPWWSKYFKENMSYNGGLYFMAGQATGGGFFATTYSMVCNLELASQIKKLDGSNYDMFDMVINGDWTLENFENMIKDYTSDLNGDGEISVYDDRLAYAHVRSDVTGSCHFIGMGMKFSSVDPNGKIIVNLESENTINAVEHLANIFDSIKNNFDHEAFFKTPSEQVISFTNDRALFMGNSMSYMDKILNMESDYAVIPCPKKDAEQKDYYSGVNTWTSGFMAFPKNAGGERADIEFVGYTTEMLGYLSYMKVKPVVYDNILCARLAKDERQVEVMDTLYNGLYIDLNIVNNFGNTAIIVTDCIFDSNLNLSSQLRSVKKILKLEIEAFEKNIEDNK